MSPSTTQDENGNNLGHHERRFKPLDSRLQPACPRLFPGTSSRWEEYGFSLSCGLFRPYKRSTMDNGKGEMNLYPLGVPSFHLKPWVKRPCLRGVTKRSNMYLKPFGAPNEWLFSPLLRANISVSRGANPCIRLAVSPFNTFPAREAQSCRVLCIRAFPTT